MTTVHGTIATIGGTAIRQSVEFSSPTLRESGTTPDRIVSPSSYRVPVMAGGDFTADLDPGPAVVRIGNQRFRFTVPASGTYELWSLIEAAVPYPPNAPDAVIAASVDSWLVAHPPTWSSSDRVLSVKSYGAIGDGTADDTAAILAAANAAVTQGVETLYLPEGTYKVSPVAGATCVTLPGGISRIVGAGRRKSIIKVANGVGDYYSILRLTAANAGIEIAHLRFDQNTTNNQITDIGPITSTKPRFCIGLHGTGSWADIHDCDFVDLDNANSINTNEGLASLTVRGNRFSLGSSPLHHDMSVIWERATKDDAVRIVDNAIEGHPTVRNSAVTGIELHGGSCTVTGNVIRNFQHGIIVSGIGPDTGGPMTVAHNTVLGCTQGIHIWTLPWGSFTGPVGLKNITIAHNHCEMVPGQWDALTPGITLARGLMLYSSQVTLPIENVDVVGNHFIYDLTGYTTVANDSLAAGIHWTRTPLGTVVDRHVRIRDNIIESPPGAGIRVSVIGDGFDITGNVVVNPGRGNIARGGGVGSAHCNGIYIEGVLTNSQITDNLILDNQASPTTDSGIRIAPSQTGSSGNRLSRNRVPVANSRVLTVDATYGVSWVDTEAPPSHPSLSGGLLQLSGTPTSQPVTSGSAVIKDRWHFMPIKLTRDVPVTQLRVETVGTAPSGGTCDGYFALYTPGPDGRPLTLYRDITTTYGVFDMLGAIGFKTLETAGLVLPAGEWWMGWAWSGTATTGPSMKTISAYHPSVAGSSSAVTNCYQSTITGAARPATIVTSLSAGTGPAIWGTLV